MSVASKGKTGGTGAPTPYKINKTPKVFKLKDLEPYQILFSVVHDPHLNSMDESDVIKFEVTLKYTDSDVTITVEDLTKP